jgi:hypothetical protein
MENNKKTTKNIILIENLTKKLENQIRKSKIEQSPKNIKSFF